MEITQILEQMVEANAAVQVTRLDSECIENAKLYAKKQMRRCPYCIQHSDDFVNRYGQQSAVDFVFSSPMAFCENGRWYHLQLCNPQKKYRGGYNWVECTASVHHEYMALLSGHRRTLDEAVSEVIL